MYKAISAGLTCIMTLGLFACGPGTVSTVTGTTTIDESYSVDGTSWEGNESLSLLFFRTRENASEAELCGAIITQGSGLYQSLESQVLQGSFVTLNGTRIANSISFFYRLPRVGDDLQPKDVMGQKARCATTGVAWQPSFDDVEPELVFRTTRATY